MDERNYIDSLNEREMKSLNIAINHLGSSFELQKSLGFLKWKRENYQALKTPSSVTLIPPISHIS